MIVPPAEIPSLRAVGSTPARTASGPGSPRPRFTLDGSDELESHLARTCRSILAGIRGLVSDKKLEAVLLGGGYGRGEGGVLKTRDGDRPYNDLEFYVCVRGNPWSNEHRYHTALHALGEILAPTAGVEVEFKIHSLARLRRSPVTMFSYDLVMGHLWLRGDDALLGGCDHHRLGADIPMAEATRLLMNRCSGLLFAQEKLDRREFTPESADFVARNQAKAKLALGDAVLTCFREYHWSCRARHRRLQALMPDELLPWLTAVRRCHEEGLRFKLHPEQTNPTRIMLQERQDALTALARHIWLWLENRRLGANFTTIRDYALCRQNKCPETKPWRNRLVNARTFGPPAVFASTATRYPRERLLNALALLLWEPGWLTDLVLLRTLQTELRTSATAFPQLVAAYRALWSRFN